MDRIAFRPRYVVERSRALDLRTARDTTTQRTVLMGDAAVVELAVLLLNALHRGQQLGAGRVVIPLSAGRPVPAEEGSMPEDNKPPASAGPRFKPEEEPESRMAEAAAAGATSPAPASDASAIGSRHEEGSGPAEDALASETWPELEDLVEVMASSAGVNIREAWRRIEAEAKAIAGGKDTPVSAAAFARGVEAVGSEADKRRAEQESASRRTGKDAGGRR